MKKKRLVLIGIVSLVLVVIVVGGAWYWNSNKKRIIRAEVEKSVEKKSDGLYKVHYDSLELDEVNGFMSVSSFTLTYDSVKYKELKQQNKQPYLVFNISIPQMRVSGVQTPRALADNEISGRRLSLINPVIEILYNGSGKESTRRIPGKEIYQQILGNLKLIKLDSVVITGAQIITRDLRSGKTLVRFENVSMSLLNVAVDSVANADPTRLLFAKEVNLDCEKFALQSRNGLYKYQVNAISFRSATSRVSIKSLLMVPALNENEFAKKVPHQTDRMDIALYNIQFRNTDFYQLADEMITTETLEIGSANFKIYRDRTRPEDKRSKIGTYPHQLLQKIPVSFDIKKAIVRKANIEYKERSTITRQTGKAQFAGSSAYITNITNRKTSIARNSKMIVDLRSSFLNKIPLYTKWTFYLGNKDGKFLVSGKGKAADARIFNSLAVPMGPVEVKSGNIKTLEFNLAGNNHKIQGTVKLLYDNFRVTLLKKDKDSVHFEKRKIASLFANLKIEDSNPDDNEPQRVAQVNLQRDIHRSIFNLAWKGLFDGIQEITNSKK
jgi:hypothetical protein